MSVKVIVCLRAATAAASVVLANPAMVGATVLQECEQAGAVIACLDAKLREANKGLNGTLKSMQERLDALQQQGRRPVQNAFVDSQRKFNAYRDAQCAWQAVHATTGARAAEYVKDCQVRMTRERDQELRAFVDSADTTVTAAPPQPADQTLSQSVAALAPADAPTAAANPAATASAEPAATTTAPPVRNETVAPRRGLEWRLAQWVVDGAERPLADGTSVTVAFDPSGKIAGHASVNSFSGTYGFDRDGRLVWPGSGFTSTRMAGPPALMEQERAFLGTLRRMTQYDIEGQRLVLKSANGRSMLAFER